MRLASLVAEIVHIKFDEGSDKAEKIRAENVVVSSIFWLADGTEINEENRPRNTLADLVFAKMTTLMRTLEDCSVAIAGREDDLRKAILRNDLASFVGDGASAAPSVVKLFAGLFDVAVAVSRAPSFQRRFKAVLDSAVSGAGGDPDPMQIV